MFNYLKRYKERIEKLRRLDILIKEKEAFADVWKPFETHMLTKAHSEALANMDDTCRDAIKILRDSLFAELSNKFIIYNDDKKPLLMSLGANMLYENIVQSYKFADKNKERAEKKEKEEVEDSPRSVDSLYQNVK